MLLGGHCSYCCCCTAVYHTEHTPNHCFLYSTHPVWGAANHVFLKPVFFYASCVYLKYVLLLLYHILVCHLHHTSNWYLLYTLLLLCVLVQTTSSSIWLLFFTTFCSSSIWELCFYHRLAPCVRVCLSALCNLHTEKRRELCQYLWAGENIAESLNGCAAVCTAINAAALFYSPRTCICGCKPALISFSSWYPDCCCYCLLLLLEFICNNSGSALFLPHTPPCICVCRGAPPCLLL